MKRKLDQLSLRLSALIERPAFALSLVVMLAIIIGTFGSNLFQALPVGPLTISDPEQLVSIFTREQIVSAHSADNAAEKTARAQKCSARRPAGAPAAKRSARLLHRLDRLVCYYAVGLGAGGGRSRASHTD